MATMAELACDAFAQDPKMLEGAKTASGSMVTPTLTALAKMLQMTPKHADGPKIWDGFLTFGRSREARSGDVLVTISAPKSRFLEPITDEVGLVGAELQYVAGLLMYPYRGRTLKGPAPRGNMERQLERLLKGLSIEDDDDDEL